ncbi:MAG: NUDIX domain-containing protein [Anaerolineales bacterium]
MEIELLVRAIIEDDGRFLIAHTKGAGNVYLPGGHVEPGEGMKNALARELAEEFGATVEVGEYLGSVEHAWEVAGVHSHEVNHFFVATSPELRAIQPPPFSRRSHRVYLALAVRIRRAQPSARALAPTIVGMESAVPPTLVGIDVGAT